MTVKTVGLDLAKDVFQVHGISENGRVIFNRPIKRAKLLAFFETLPPCVVGMEACGSSHHWGRQLRTLGHDVKLMPAGYVKPYVKRGKNDAVDAEAICEGTSQLQTWPADTRDRGDAEVGLVFGKGSNRSELGVLTIQ
jgi:transposase